MQCQWVWCCWTHDLILLSALPCSVKDKAWLSSRKSPCWQITFNARCPKNALPSWPRGFWQKNARWSWPEIQKYLFLIRLFSFCFKKSKVLEQCSQCYKPLMDLEECCLFVWHKPQTESDNCDSAREINIRSQQGTLSLQSNKHKCLCKKVTGSINFQTRIPSNPPQKNFFLFFKERKQ